MKLITLNIWGGHVRAPLLRFIKVHQNIDVFCFQEVYHQAPHKISLDNRLLSLNIFEEFQALLPQHQGFFRPIVNHFYGLAIFIKKSLEILGEGDIRIHENSTYPGRGPTHARNLQWLHYRTFQQTYYILNVHGLWNGQGKTDTAERLAQSQVIKAFMDSLKAPKILCGDFNLRPDTQSIHLLAQGMNNLIQTQGITSTRPNLYPKTERFADYILTSPEIAIHQFKVLPEAVSDHAPLLLDFF